MISRSIKISCFLKKNKSYNKLRTKLIKSLTLELKREISNSKRKNYSKVLKVLMIQLPEKLYKTSLQLLIEAFRKQERKNPKIKTATLRRRENVEQLYSRSKR